MAEIYLRGLQGKDAPYMLEWMQDPAIACFFRFDAQKMTVDSCRDFILKSGEDSRCRHFAIAKKDTDEYLGTVSLKQIDQETGEAEYAISTRKKAHGTGAAFQATRLIWKIAFEDYRLRRVYLNVLAENQRANAFYRKVGYRFEYCEENAVEIQGVRKHLNWYAINRQEYMEITENESFK